MPGIWIVTSSIVCAQIGITRICQLNNKNNPLQSFLKSPVSLGEIITSYFIIAICYGVIQLTISMVVLNLINQGSYTIYQNITVFLQILSMIIFISGFSMLIGFISEKRSSVSIVLLLLFSIISFGFGGMIPIQLFPEELSSLLIKIPMVNIIENTQNILLLEPVQYWGAVITTMVGLILLLINVAIGHKTLRK